MRIGGWRPRARGEGTRFWPDAQRRRSRWPRFFPLWAGAVAAGTAYGAGWLDNVPFPDWPSAKAEASTPGQQSFSSEQAIRADFGLCHSGGGTNCVVDGDTLWLGGTKIRVADIDAPETHPPRCAFEAELGDRATRRLRDLLNGGAVSLQAADRDEDRYGRKLRIVLVDGRSVGDRLVDEGLARPWEGRRRAWC